MVSTCDSWMRSFSGVRRSDNSGKKLKIGSSMLRISPRSIAIPSASDATLFETDFTLCNVSASKVTFSTGGQRTMPGIWSAPVASATRTVSFHRARDQIPGRFFGPRVENVSFDADTLHNVKSVSKSVASLALGIAIDRGLIRSIDEPVFSFFPELSDLRTPKRTASSCRTCSPCRSG